MNESNLAAKVGRLEGDLVSLARQTEHVAALKKRNWLDWILSGVGVAGVIAVLTIVRGKASASVLDLTSRRVDALEQVQATQTEALTTLKQLQLEMRTTLERVDTKIDRVLLALPRK